MHEHDELGSVTGGLGRMSLAFKNISHELKTHAPFTAFGTVTGIGLMLLIVFTRIPDTISGPLFWTTHPAHVFLSALVTTAMYRLHSRRRLLPTLVIGYVGSIGIATISDCIIPYIGEYLLQLPNKGAHLGFIEERWIVNPAAIAGILIAIKWSKTKVPHAGHVLLSTWASLFHMTMALGGELTLPMVLLIAVFLFLAVWVPCCTSDIVFPLLFARQKLELAPHHVS